MILVELLSISSIERDPQEDETPVVIVAQGGTLPPAQGSMNAQIQVDRVAISYFAVALFQGFMGKWQHDGNLII